VSLKKGNAEMATESQKKRAPSPKVLRAINDGLDEIESYLDFSVSISSMNTEAAAQIPESHVPNAPEEEDDQSGTEEGEDDQDEYDTDDQYIDREEIEVALDAFLSQLISADVIRKPKSGKTPSFTWVFERFFGKDHPVSEHARGFEEFIKGYFGWVSPDNMDSAQESFFEIREIVREALTDDGSGAR
jgi:hypothetical protein